MNNGKYLLCTCIDEAITFYLTQLCQRIITLYDYNWHVSGLKLSENQILSGSDFGIITFYEFDFEHDYFKNKKKKLNFEETKSVEKLVDIEIPEEFKKENKKYGHGERINQIRKFEDTIISTSCYEKDDKFFCELFNKEDFKGYKIKDLPESYQDDFDYFKMGLEARLRINRDLDLDED
jgi:hypothetical protein